MVFKLIIPVLICILASLEAHTSEEEICILFLAGCDECCNSMENTADPVL